MVDRLTVDEFFEALRANGVYPFVDTPDARQSVDRTVRALCINHPIQDRWPVLDLESSYEAFLNSHINLMEWVRHGYTGTIHAGDFDYMYTLEEWFGDFTKECSLTDTPEVRQAMLGLLPPHRTWSSSFLFHTHRKVVERAKKGILRRLFG